MSNVNHDEVLRLLNWRYAVKKFDPEKKISDKDWQLLEKSLVLSPSSYGLQPWKFLVVQNPELRQKLKAASWNQTQVTDCSHFVVFTCLKHVDEAHIQKYLEQIVKVRGVNLESLAGFKNSMVGDLVKGPRSKQIQTWAQRQLYIAMGFLMETAAIIEVDTCPMEGLDPKLYDEILGLKETQWETTAAVAIGIRHPDCKLQKVKKVRFDTEQVVEFIK